MDTVIAERFPDITRPASSKIIDAMIVDVTGQSTLNRLVPSGRPWGVSVWLFRL